MPTWPEDYPSRGAAYEGPMSSTFRSAQVEAHPLESHVSAYHHGRSDLVEPVAQERITTKITSIFKKAQHEPDFPPISTPYLGPVAQRQPIAELAKSPLEQHVTVYNIGHYDQHMPPEQQLQQQPGKAHEELATEPEKKGGTLEKLTHLFKRSKTTAVAEDFPAQSEPFIGPLSSTGPAHQIPAEPIHTLVSVYSSGRSDEMPPMAISSSTTAVTAATDYPIAEAPFSGHVPATMRRGELEGTPLEAAHVTAYHPGRSDLLLPEMHAPVPMEPTEKQQPGTFVTKISSIFKKSHEDDYPAISSEPYPGHIDETQRHSELEPVPIDGHVQKVHKGYYDELTTMTAVPVAHEERREELTPSEAEKKPGALERLGHLFKRTGTHDEGYPPHSGR